MCLSFHYHFCCYVLTQNYWKFFVMVRIVRNGEKLLKWLVQNKNSLDVGGCLIRTNYSEKCALGGQMIALMQLVFPERWPFENIWLFLLKLWNLLIFFWHCAILLFFFTISHLYLINEHSPGTVATFSGLLIRSSGSCFFLFLFFCFCLTLHRGGKCDELLRSPNTSPKCGFVQVLFFSSP